MDTRYAVRMRETGERSHRLLSSGEFTDRWLHAVFFDSQGAAVDAALWMFDHNPGSFDSAQVVSFRGRRVVERIAP